MQLIILNTAYKRVDVYDYDNGLTASQLRDLANGINAQRKDDFTRELQVWQAVAPLVAGAVAYGFTGQPEALNDVRSRLRYNIAVLMGHEKPSPPPTDEGERPQLPPPPGDQTTQRERMRQVVEQEAAARRAQQVIRSHPLFAANLSKETLAKLQR